MNKNKEKIKCWVVYDEDYPMGVIYRDRTDALEISKNYREEGIKTYARVKYFTEEELESFPEAD
jgi:hypothetical protein